MGEEGRSHRVVIVGGGFGGLNAARRLARAPVSITLVDRRNHHLFQPLLYQVATAALNPSDIAIPIRRILRHQSNVEVLLAEAIGVRFGEKKLLLDEGSIDYQHLIIATGARHSYYGNDAWRPCAPGLKSIGDALEIRRRILSAFELAEREPDPEKRAAWLTFVVVGAGPTGVELSGALCEIAQHALARDFRRIRPAQARVVLLEGSSRVLPPYPAGLSEKARLQLQRLGVTCARSRGSRRSTMRASRWGRRGFLRGPCSGLPALRARGSAGHSVCHSIARGASSCNPT